MVHLEKITQDNYRERVRLNVAEQQRHYVVPNATSLAKAYAFYDTARPFVVYNDDMMIGFVLLRNHQELGYIIDQFMIDERYQGKGYGTPSYDYPVERVRREISQCPLNRMRVGCTSSWTGAL